MLLGLCNSKVAISYLKAISPGMDTQVGQVRSIPFVSAPMPIMILIVLVENANISLSKS
jgi:hypothetical protein